MIGLKTNNKGQSFISEDPGLKAPLTLSESMNMNSAQQTGSTFKSSQKSKSSIPRKPLPGKYSFARVKTEDFKTMNHDQKKLLENYRNSIKKLLKTLDRTPIESRDQLRDQVRQLTKELEEIQDNVDTYDPSIQKLMAQKYE